MPRRIKEQAQLDAQRLGAKTYISATPHIKRDTKECCGTFERYTASGDCVYCGCNKHKALPKRMTARESTTAERMTLAIQAYANGEATMAVCAQMYSVAPANLSDELHQRKLITKARPKQDKALSVFDQAMSAFKPVATHSSSV